MEAIFADIDAQKLNIDPRNIEKIMNEDLEIILDMAKESMSNAISHLEKKLINIRAGKANPNMLTNVFVDYYGTNTPISQVANINTPDGRTLIVQPWDKSMLQEIEKGIEIANLGFNPMNNGENVIINIPVLTEERRRELVKQAKSEVEEAKIAIRNARKDANNEIKKTEDFSEDLKKNSELDIQEITDKNIFNIQLNDYNSSKDSLEKMRIKTERNIKSDNACLPERKLKFKPNIVFSFIMISTKNI